jgi:hypothetical protein
LSPHEMETLQAWREVYGRSWRWRLNTAWQNHDYRGMSEREAQILAFLRNSRGPNWLAAFEWPKEG